MMGTGRAHRRGWICPEQKGRRKEVKGARQEGLWPEGSTGSVAGRGSRTGGRGRRWIRGGKWNWESSLPGEGSQGSRVNRRWAWTWMGWWARRERVDEST